MDFGRRIVAACALAALVLGACVSGSEPPPSTDATRPAASDPAAAPAQRAEPDPWPRKLESGLATMLVFSPQVESFDGNVLVFRSAVAAMLEPGAKEHYGTVWVQARTEVDRNSRQVTLYDAKLTRSTFPTLADGGTPLLVEIATLLPKSSKTVALDRIETSLAASGATRPRSQPVQNPVPQIRVSYSPSLLIRIDGAPVLRRIEGTPFERVINTRPLLAREISGAAYYLHIYDGWLVAPALSGPWRAGAAPPPGLDALASALASGQQVDLLVGAGAEPRPTLERGVPAIFVSEVPTELIEFAGPPRQEPIRGTRLAVCTNTDADVIVDPNAGHYYALLSGRWFRADRLEGAWSYIPSTSLPADFAAIPPDSRAGPVLASVAGTPQAREAVISNSIPHTEKISLRDPPVLETSFDGPAKLLPISGTSLQYVANSPTPVIAVDALTWYALRAAVWFRAESPSGPWRVATSVPVAIYGILPSSPLHYVTYVQIYGATDEYVYVGYTAGYHGTVVNSEGVVVYGTGYAYPPWVGTVYYAPPPTYSAAVVVVPAGWMAPYPYYGAPYYYGYACCGSASVTANVHGQYGATTWSGTKTAYANASGYGVESSGTYQNARTGSTGSYSGERNYDYSSNTSSGSASHTTNTAAGGTRSAESSASYDWDSGSASASRSTSGTTTTGGEYSRDATVSSSPGSTPTVERESSYTSARTGETYSSPTGGRADDLYSSPTGEVHQRSEGSWQKASASGWERASGDTSWADREAKGRSRADQRLGGRGGGGSRGGGRGGGGSRGGGRR